MKRKPRSVTPIDDKAVDCVFDAVGRCLTPRAARKIVELRADPELQSRIDELADNCNQGRLTVTERVEYETYVRAIHFVTVLQSKTRRLLTRAAAL